MLSFFSASTRMVNTGRGVTECLETALGPGTTDCDLIILHAAVGHSFPELIEQAAQLAPHAKIVAASCCGIVGREGVSESLKDIALMAIRGEEFAMAHVNDIYGRNSYDKSRELALSLKAQQPGINMIYFLASGIDIDNDQCIAGIESVFGPEVTIFGATSSDNMKGVISFQAADGQVMEHGAYAIGFSDPTLTVETQATHGFVAIGEPLTVTRSEGHLIHELDGKPAWQEYTRRLGLAETANCGDSIPVGALAEKLPAEMAAEYGNPHILRVVTKRDGNTMHYATTCPEGTKLWLTVRDEEKIFTEMDHMVQQMNDRASGKNPWPFSMPTAWPEAVTS
jgi:hypothetical protein